MIDWCNHTGTSTDATTSTRPTIAPPSWLLDITGARHGRGFHQSVLMALLELSME